MKISKVDLLAVVSDVQSASGAKIKGASPILDYLLIRATDGVLSATASSGEIEVESKIQTECEDFEVLLHAKKISDILKTSAADIIDIALGDRVKIKSGKSRFTVASEQVESFPFFDEINCIAEFDVEGEEFKRRLQSVMYAMADQDVRYYLNGMLIDGRGDYINMVATDGHRLSKTQVEAKAEGQWIVPKSSILEIVRLINGPVNIRLSADKLLLTSGRVTIKTKLIDGRYPNYEMVIPELVNDSFTTNTKELKAAINRIVILSSQKLRSIRFEISQDGLSLSSRNTEDESASEVFDVDYQGDECDMGMNGVYLGDALGNCSSEAVIYIKDSGSAIKIEDGFSTHIVMPMRL